MTMPRAKRMTDAELFALGEEILAKDHSKFDDWERVTTKADPKHNPPITIRMMPRLVERLDRIAAAQHRSRSSLIQHVMWEYALGQDGVKRPVTAKPAPPKKTAARAPAPKKNAPRKRVTSA
jgi:hypothetical protein